MIELFVENRKIDIDKGFSTLLTLAIDDIKDFGAKNTTFSKTIVIPGTKSNNINFGNIFNPNAGSTYNPADANIAYNFNAAIAAKAYIFADNLQIFKGIFRILEIIVDDGNIEYECAVFGELGGFVAKVGNNKLEDLDFSAYNQSYTYANITSTTNVGTGAGVVYPLIDYGTYSTAKKDWSYRTLRPALHVKEYIDKIFTASGYSYNCALFNTSRFKSLVVPHNQKLLTARNTRLLDRVAANQTVDDAQAALVTFGSGTLGSFTTSDSQTFTFTGSATLVDITCFITIESYTGFPDSVNLQVRKNSTPIYTLAVTTTGSYDLSVADVSLATNDTIDVRISSIIDVEAITFYGFIYIDANAAQPTPLLLGDSISINDTIPKNILQKDFVSSVIKLFNLYVFEDYENENVLKIEPFVDFYANATAVDWSNKLDRSKPVRIKPMSELNSRYFEFNYKDDSDYYNDLYKKRYNLTYGSMKYDSEFEFANEVTKVDLIFSPTPLVGYVGEDKVYSTIFKQSNNVEENIDSNIRVLQTKVVTGVASWAIKDGATTLGTQTQYIYAGHFDDPDLPTNDLNFGVPRELFFDLSSGAINVNQFNVYWNSYLAEITDKDSRLLTATFKLSYKDIYQLDFSKLIWLDGNLYRLNKIIDFNASEPDTCKVELLKIINRIY